MKTAVLFGGSSSLDFQEVRMSLCRIPEVSLRLEEAQKIWDSECSASLSFAHFLSSDDAIFYSSINLKSLIHAIVQIGLYDRYIRKHNSPEVMIGNTQSDSALMVCAGLMTMRELVMASRACSLSRPTAPLQIAGETLLNGQTLPKFDLFVKTNVEQADKSKVLFRSTEEAATSIEGILRVANDVHGINEIIHIGPAGSQLGHQYTAGISDDLRFMDSIDLDPMLGWFWTDIRKQEATAI